MDCPSNKKYDAGLCYTTCRAGFYGVGPVCWANAPNGWVGCGMGAAKTSSVCAETIFDQVASVGNLALNIVTFGTEKAADIAKDAAKAAELRKQFEQLKKLSENSEKVQQAIQAGQGKFPIVEAGKSTAEILKADPTTVTTEDIVRVSAQVASLIDPTGVSDVVGAFTYPKCS
jgi:predicted lipid-binding transport protein (Tim44 family)